MDSEVEFEELQVELLIGTMLGDAVDACLARKGDDEHDNDDDDEEEEEKEEARDEDDEVTTVVEMA